MPRECVCERKDVHAYCSKMLAAQQKKTTPWLNWRSDNTTLRKSKKKTSNIGMIWLFRWATRLARRQGRDAALPSRCETSASSFWGRRWRSAGGWKIAVPVARPSPRSTAHSVARQVVRPTAWGRWSWACWLLLPPRTQAEWRRLSRLHAPALHSEPAFHARDADTAPALRGYGTRQRTGWTP